MYLCKLSVFFSKNHVKTLFFSTFALITCLAFSLAQATPTDHLTIHLDQARPYEIHLKSVEVYPRKANGNSWDPVFKGKPDLLIQVFVDQHQVYLSKVQRDTISVKLNQKTQAFQLKPGQSEIKVIVLDKDLGTRDDLIGELNIYPTQNDILNQKSFRLANRRIKELQLQVLKRQDIQTTSISTSTPPLQTNQDLLDPNTPLPLLEGEPTELPLETTPDPSIKPVQNDLGL